MGNRQGEYIWYELMTPDIEGAKAFYQSVIGWTIGDKSDMPGMDYRMLQAPDGPDAPDRYVGGVLALSEDMIAGGAFPLWIGYIGVDNVDASVQAIRDAGGTISMEPRDVPGAGRMAMASDPQGAPFYVMRGSVEDGTSTVFGEKLGHCAWNELSTKNQQGAHDFYERVIGWTNPENMPMGPMGDYRFLYVGDDLRIGATMEQKDQPTRWRHYFVVASINAAIDAVKAGGGTVTHGPHPVPGGGNIIMGIDPQGAQFALVGEL